VVVVLNFRVDTEGKIDSIRIIRSPNKNFSDEAIRLIKEGPGWKPAEENGKTINDEVRIRIVFR
jgi:TonB family protein